MARKQTFPVPFFTDSQAETVIIIKKDGILINTDKINEIRIHTVGNSNVSCQQWVPVEADFSQVVGKGTAAVSALRLRPSGQSLSVHNKVK